MNKPHFSRLSLWLSLLLAQAGFVSGCSTEGATGSPAVASNEGSSSEGSSSATTESQDLFADMSAAALARSGGKTGPVPWTLLGARRFNGVQSVYWQSTATATNGQIYIQLVDNTGAQISVVTVNGVAALNPATWAVVSIGEFTNDNRADILYRNVSSGQFLLWSLNSSGRVVFTQTAIGTTLAPSNDLKFVGAGDFNNDNVDDIAWRRASTGEIVVWRLAYSTLTSPRLQVAQTRNQVGNVTIASAPPWQFLDTMDRNGDGIEDILWYNTSTRRFGSWQLNNNFGVAQIVSSFGAPYPSTNPQDSGWVFVGAGDYNGDALDDFGFVDAARGLFGTWVFDGGIGFAQVGAVTPPEI